MVTSEQREQNGRIDGIDFIKVLSMILITIIHYIEYNDALAYMHGLTKFVLTILSTASSIAVNLFTVVTGYLLCEKKSEGRRVINIWREGWFYSVILFIPGMIIMNGRISGGNMIRTVFPVLSQHYWYLTMIVLLYLLSPVLNIVIKTLTGMDFRKFIIVVGIVITVFFAANPFIPEEVYLGHPHGFIWLIYLYFVGAYIKKYVRSENKFFWRGVAGICFVCIFMIRWFNVSVSNISLLSQYSLFQAILQYPFLFHLRIRN